MNGSSKARYVLARGFGSGLQLRFVGMNCEILLVTWFIGVKFSHGEDVFQSPFAGAPGLLSIRQDLVDQPPQEPAVTDLSQWSSLLDP